MDTAKYVALMPQNILTEYRKMWAAHAPGAGTPAPREARRRRWGRTLLPVAGGERRDLRVLHHEAAFEAISTRRIGARIANVISLQIRMQ